MPTISNLGDAALNEIIDSIARTPASALAGRVPPDLLAVAAAALAAAAEDAESAAAADDGAASAAGDGVGAASTAGDAAMAVDEAAGRHFVAGAIKRSRIVVFSKSTCGPCKRVRSLLDAYTKDAQYVELDARADMSDCQDALEQLTGRRTVPQVFVGGKSIGGSDDAFRKHNCGTLAPALEAAGVTMAPRLPCGLCRGCRSLPIECQS
jgi:glutaredoxin 3